MDTLNTFTEIRPTKQDDDLYVEYLADTLSDFPGSDELLAVKHYRKRMGLRVKTLIRFLEIYGHLGHQKAIFDPLEVSKKETKSVRDRTGILILHICGSSDEDLKMYVEK